MGYFLCKIISQSVPLFSHYCVSFFHPWQLQLSFLPLLSQVEHCLTRDQLAHCLSLPSKLSCTLCDGTMLLFDLILCPKKPNIKLQVFTHRHTIIFVLWLHFPTPLMIDGLTSRHLLRDFKKCFLRYFEVLAPPPPPSAEKNSCGPPPYDDCYIA